MTATSTARTPDFATRLRTAVAAADGRSVPEHRRARDWHRSVEVSVANPTRTRRLRAPGESAEDFATRLRRAVG